MHVDKLNEAAVGVRNINKVGHFSTEHTVTQSVSLANKWTQQAVVFHGRVREREREREGKREMEKEERQRREGKRGRKEVERKTQN